MSMEQAILEHAGALRELAAAIKSMGGGWQPLHLATGETIQGILTEQEDRAVRSISEASTAPIRQKPAGKKEAPAERDVDQQARGVCTEAAEEVEPDAELEAAVAKVEEAAKPLDYQVDVRPVLMAVAKSKDLGAPRLKELLAKYGAPNGDKLKPTDYAAILADANELLGN